MSYDNRSYFRQNLSNMKKVILIGGIIIVIAIGVIGFLTLSETEDAVDDVATDEVETVAIADSSAVDTVVATEEEAVEE
jgi:amino acid permease